ncbi:MAG: hypothetical protein H6613_18415 [Ignavibacteriales bacterium]|nr:hypothetical protein [Ignavibacteriales bacterium]
MKIPFEENLDSKEISIHSLSNSKLKNTINFNTKKLIVNETKNSFSEKDFISDEFDYYVNSEIIGKLLEGNLEADLRQMSIKFNSANQLPIVARLVNEKKLLNDKNAYVENEYPLLYDRRRNNLSGGFLDYSLTGNYVENENPFYSFNFGLGGELFGGDAQVFSQHSLFQNKFIYNQTEYRWRYAFLNNKDISSISLGNNNIFGLQSYNFRGINITNQPLESKALLW